MASVAQTSIKINTAQATAALNTLNVSLTATLSGFEGLERALNENTAALQKAKNAGDGVGRTLDAVDKKAQKAKRGLSGLITPLKQLIGLYSMSQVAQAGIANADNYASNMARFKTITGSAKAAEDMYHRVYQSAQRTRAPLQDVASAVGKIAINTKGAFNNEEAIAFVEIMSKAGKVAGSSASEQASALYQMTQALASGRLAGDEFKSIRENAPRIYQAIQEELKKQLGSDTLIDDVAAKNLITTDVIKAAVFNSAQQIEKEYKQIPMKIGEYFEQIKNKVVMALNGIWQEISGFINRSDVKQVINTTVNAAIKGIYIAWGAIKKVGSVVMSLVNVFYKLRWVILAVTAAMVLYKIVSLAHLGITKLIAAWTFIKSFAIAAWNLGLAMAVLMTGKLNQAQLVNLMLNIKIVAIILVIIAVIYVVIKNLDVLMGIVYMLGAVCENVWTWIKDKAEICWIGVQLAAINVLSAIWKFTLEVCDGIVNAFASAVNSVVGLVNGLASKLGDTALGEKLGLKGFKLPEMKRSNLVGESDFLKGADIYKQELNAKLVKSALEQPQYKDVWKAYDKGERKGASWQKGMKNGVTELWDKAKGALALDALTPGVGKGGDLDKYLGSIGDLDSFGDSGADGLGKALKDNTNALKDNTASNKEDNYELMRDVMKQRAINRIGNSGGTVKIDMVNNNNLNSKLDIKSFLEQLAKTMEEAASTSARGVHN